MDREEIIRQIESNKVIVILRGLSKEKILKTVDAIYKGGILLVEITFDQSGKICDDQTAENIKILNEVHGKDMIIGAGTVLTLEQLNKAIKAGAKFIISPDTCEDIIKKTKELGAVSIPGAYTPTEVANANRWGADFVKLFPSYQGGIKYLKMVSEPLSHIKYFAAGGVDLAHIKDYFEAGAVCVGIASGIANQKLIEDDDYVGIQRLAESFVKAVK